MAVFDTSFLVYLFDKHAGAPIDPTTDQPVSYFKERIEHLVLGLEKLNEKIVIPTPVLSEYLVKAEEAGVQRLQYMQNKGVFQIADFDARAAVELAALCRVAPTKGKKAESLPRQIVKLDRQIIAIAKVSGEKVIYSGDLKLHRFAEEAHLKPYAVWDLDLPPEDAQGKLIFEEPNDEGI